MSVELENPEAPTSPSEEVQAAESAPQTGLAQAAAGQRVDFRHPVFLSSTEWRTVRLEVDEFAESLGALLSTYFRLEVGLRLVTLETIPFSDFLSSLPASTHLTLLNIDPLTGASVLEMGHGLSSGIIDRVLGGPGHPSTVERNLTEMEIALMDQVVQLILGEWCKQWRRFQELRPEIVGHENNPRFLQRINGDTVMILLSLEARLGECAGQIRLAMPYHSLEPILAQVIETAAPAPAPVPPKPNLRWNRNLEAVPIALRAEWPSFKLPARDLLRLQVGEILPLQPQAAEQIELRVGKFAKFRGRLGTRDKKWAIQITDISRL